VVWTGLNIAALGILMADPLELFRPAFQLSFGAVAALAGLTPVFDNAIHETSAKRLSRWSAFIAMLMCLALRASFGWKLAGVGLTALIALATPRIISSCLKNIALPPKPARALRGLVASQIGIQIGALIPLSAYWFGSYSVAGIPVNMIVIPLSGVHLPLTLTLGIVDAIPAIGPGLASILAHPVEWLTDLILFVSWLGARTFEYPAAATPPAWLVIGYYVTQAIILRAALRRRTSPPG
jgi:hypothetical protein